MRGRHVKYRWLVPDFGFFFPRPLRYGIVIHAVGIGIGEEDCGSKSSPWQRHTILKYRTSILSMTRVISSYGTPSFSPSPPGLNGRVQGPNLYGL